MAALVLVLFTIIAVSLSDAHFRKANNRPNIELFEIRQNQLTKKLEVEPVNLQYDLESEEKEPQATKLTKLLLSLKKSDDTPRGILKRPKGLKGGQGVQTGGQGGQAGGQGGQGRGQGRGQGSKKKAQQSIVFIVSPEYLDVLDSQRQSEQDFIDETRAYGPKKLGSEVVFNIVPPRRARKALRQPRLPISLRSGDGVEDRTNPPPPRHVSRPYVLDYNEEHY